MFNLSRKFTVEFEADFKDGNLFPQLKDLGFRVSEVSPGTIPAGATGEMPERLYLMCEQSGALMRIDDQVYIKPPSVRMPEPPEPEEEPEEELEPATLEALDMTDAARKLAVEYGLHPAELLDSVEDGADHRFSKPDVQRVIDLDSEE